MHEKTEYVLDGIAYFKLSFYNSRNVFDKEKVNVPYGLVSPTTTISYRQRQWLVFVFVTD